MRITAPHTEPSLQLHFLCLRGRTASFSKPAAHEQQEEQWCSSGCLSHSLLPYSLSLPVPSRFGQLFVNPLSLAFIQHSTKAHSSCYFKAKYNDSDGLHLYLALELPLVKSGLDKPSMDHTMLIKHLHTPRFLWLFPKHQIHQGQSIFPSKTQSLSHTAADTPSLKHIVKALVSACFLLCCH